LAANMKERGSFEDLVVDGGIIYLKKKTGLDCGGGGVGLLFSEFRDK